MHVYDKINNNQISKSKLNINSDPNIEFTLWNFGQITLDLIKVNF